MKKLFDLRLFGLVAILIVALVFIGVDFIESQVNTQGKPDKPDKPPGKSKTEWIQFSGELEGGQPVDGCCPNAGPFPPYYMCLNFPGVGFSDGTCIDGQLFINGYGAGRDNRYIVQFWNDDLEIFIEIIGGEINYNKKTRVLTVTFEDEECVEYWTGNTTPIPVRTTPVTFTLVRGPY